MCEKHNKPCLYLRPQKKRGPAKGYRSTLNSLNESAAAWGAALNLIPSLGPVIEGYLKAPEGQRLIQAIRDPKQQDFFIRSWQESGVFRAFFSTNESTPEIQNGSHLNPEGQDVGELPELTEPPSIQELQDLQNMQASLQDPRAIQAMRAVQRAPQPHQHHAMTGGPDHQNAQMPLQYDGDLPIDIPPHAMPQSMMGHHGSGVAKSPAMTTVSSHSYGDITVPKFTTQRSDRPSLSLSDIVARDAARS